MDDGTATDDAREPPAGLVSVRGALYGIGLLWLTAMAAFGAVQAAVYGATTEPAYVLFAVGAAALAVAAGRASLRALELT